MPRILLLITDLEIGGTPTVVRELAIRLNAGGGAEVEVACLSRWGPVADQLIRAAIAVTPLEADSTLSFPRTVFRLARLIRDRNIDTIFSFLVHANAVAAAASRLCTGVRWLQSIQTTQPTPRWHWHVQAIAQHAAERIVVPSPSVARVAMDWAGVPEEKIIVIPNAVDPGDYHGLKVKQGEDTGGSPVPRSEMRVGFIGRLDPIKRIPDLLEAMTLLDPSVHLHIYGEGADRPRIEATIRQLMLDNRVTLHGEIARPEEALSKIDVLVLPSQAEGFGLVLIEAMAAGVPVVATNVPGICDVVRNAETGLLVPVASPGALAEGIKSLLTNMPLRAALIAHALDDVHRRFSWEVVFAQYQELLA